MSLHRTALLSIAVALASALAPAEIDRANKPAPVKPKQTPGNPSGHTPHQGKREMERRRKRAAITEETRDE